MIDTSGAIRELSPDEIYAVDWLNKNYFCGKINQTLKRTIFEVEKDGIKDEMIIPLGFPATRVNISELVERFEHRHSIKVNLCRGKTA